MLDSVRKEVEKIIKEYVLCCSVDEFENKVTLFNHWDGISQYERLSEDFIRYFKHRVYIVCCNFFA